MLKERVYSREGINEVDYDPRRSSPRLSTGFRRTGSGRSSVGLVLRSLLYRAFIFFQNFDNMFLGKNRISTSARSSVVMENGQLNPLTPRASNFLNPDDKKRASPQLSETSLHQPQFGKTLNVPDQNALQVIPAIVAPAPITPPRPAIMTTPKSSVANAKNNSAAEIRPTLLVTTVNDQQQPQTITVPNNRRLPVNGRIATIAPTKLRQQPVAPMANNSNHHQTINETTPKNIPIIRPRPAVYIAGTRMRRFERNSFLFENDLYLENPEQAVNNANNTTNRYHPTDSQGPAVGSTNTWSPAPPKFVIFLARRSIHFSLSHRILPPPPPPTRVLPVQTAPTLINTAAPRPQPTTRQLPPLPTRQLPIVNQSSASSLYFDFPNEDEEIMKEKLPRTGELFYYQTSSSSTSNNSLTTVDSDNDNNEQPDEEDDDEEDDNRRNQRLQSDEDDD